MRLVDGHGDHRNVANPAPFRRHPIRVRTRRDGRSGRENGSRIMRLPPSVVEASRRPMWVQTAGPGGTRGGDQPVRPAHRPKRHAHVGSDTFHTRKQVAVFTWTTPRHRAHRSPDNSPLTTSLGARVTAPFVGALTAPRSFSVPTIPRRVAREIRAECRFAGADADGPGHGRCEDRRAARS